MPDTPPPHPSGPGPAQAVQMLPTRIPLSPVPTGWDFDILPANGGQLVALRIQTPTGVQVHLLQPPDAIAVGDQLRSTGTRAKLGLVIPS